jgi:ribonuclease D
VLTECQMQYAREDVRYLHRLRFVLASTLAEEPKRISRSVKYFLISLLKNTDTRILAKIMRVLFRGKLRAT